MTTPARPARVLQLCAVDFTVRSFLCPLIEFLAERGLDVRVGCAPGPYWPALEERGFRMTPLPVQRGRNPFAHTRSVLRVARYLRRERIDILHVHTPVASLVGRLAAALARTPLVFYTAHGFYFHDEMPPGRRRLHVGLERLAGRATDFIFACSDEDRRAAIAEGVIASDRIRTIWNGIDAARFDPDRFTETDRLAARREVGLPAEAPVVSISGRLVREKGYFEFMEAAARLRERWPDARYLVLGDALTSDHDDSKRALADHVRRLGIGEIVVFAGMRDDMPEMLLASDVFCLPSYREGMPYSILEAMAMRRPVVTTNIRGCREEVVDGETGFLVPTRDADALAGKLGRLLDSPGEARRMGEAGRRRVLDMFTEADCLARQWEAYERLMAAKGLA